MKVFEISRLAGSFKLLFSTTARFSVYLRFSQEIRYCSESVPPDTEKSRERKRKSPCVM